MRLAAWIGFTAAALVACNAIVGVEEVTLRRARGNPNLDDGGDGEPNPEDDASTPGIDRGTLALGLIHTCARLPTNGVVCWGDNGAGQLGLGVAYDAGAAYTDQATKPMPVPGITEATAIASGGTSTCALQGGKVLCWGSNSQGQLGVTGPSRLPGPTEVADIDDAVGLAAGLSFACAIRSDASLWCWGSNLNGQLGNGDTTKTSTAKPGAVSGLTGVASASGGGEHACAVLESGEVWCWGGNGWGQLGNGTTNESLVPVRAPSLSHIVQVAAGARSTCARQRSGRVFCFGSNQFGELGNGSPSTAANPSPIAVPGLTDATWIWAGADHVCAVKRGGSVVCWGAGTKGQLGGGAVADASVPRPTVVPSITGARAVWTGGTHTCALLDEGRAYCWGSNSLGELGNGSRTETSPTPGAVSNFP